MRTTVDIPDGLYRRMKSRAAEQATSVKALLLDGAELVMNGHNLPRQKKLSLPLIKGKGPKIKLTNADIEKLLSS